MFQHIAKLTWVKVNVNLLNEFKYTNMTSHGQGKYAQGSEKKPIGRTMCSFKGSFEMFLLFTETASFSHVQILGPVY